MNELVRQSSVAAGAAPIAIEQPDLQRRFQVGDRLRYRWLGHAEMARRLRHAALLDD